MENFYKILGVEPHANSEQIKTSYVSLLTRYHPDIYNGDKDYAEKYTALLGEAYNTLKDTNKRLAYDRRILNSPYQSLQQRAAVKFVNTKRKTPKIIKILTSPFLYVPVLLAFTALIVVVLTSYFV